VVKTKAISEKLKPEVIEKRRLAGIRYHAGLDEGLFKSQFSTGFLKKTGSFNMCRTRPIGSKYA